MANLLGVIVTWFTFPGVILHEWSHKLFCDLAGIPVYEVKYFRLSNPAGYVRHGPVARYRDAFLITIALFLINSILAMALFIIPALNFNGIINLVFIWLGGSFAIHAFPSDGDAQALWNHSGNAWRSNPIALIGYPLVGIIMLANLLRMFWFDLPMRSRCWALPRASSARSLSPARPSPGCPRPMFRPRIRLPNRPASSRRHRPIKAPRAAYHPRICRASQARRRRRRTGYPSPGMQLKTRTATSSLSPSAAAVSR